MARHPQRTLIRLALCITVAALAAGCAGTRPPATQAPAPPVPVEEASIPAPQQPSRPEGVGERDQTPPPAATGSTQAPTLALLQQSRHSADSGDLESAIAYVERAIRLSPRDAELWLQLARLQLASGRAGRAEQTAHKALSLANRALELQRDSWLVIADAREAQGDASGAARIRAQWRTYRG